MGYGDGMARLGVGLRRLYGENTTIISLFNPKRFVLIMNENCRVNLTNTAANNYYRSFFGVLPLGLTWDISCFQSRWLAQPVGCRPLPTGLVFTRHIGKTNWIEDEHFHSLDIHLLLYVGVTTISSEWCSRNIREEEPIVRAFIVVRLLVVNLDGICQQTRQLFFRRNALAFLLHSPL